MRKTLCLLPLMALSLVGCGESISDAVPDIQVTNSNGFADGKMVSGTAASTGAFNAVQTLGPDNIIFVTGNSFSIKAEGNAKAVATLRYKIEDDAIIIGREKGNWFGEESKGVTVTITAPTLSAASLAGSGDFTADKMTGDDVEVKIAGSGSLNVANVEAKKLEAQIAGSGGAVISGKAESADFSVLGSGSIDAQKLTVTDAETSIAGSGDVRVNATGKVKAKVAGSGDITVTGGATCESKSMGSGDISCS
jgi:hypothetical protein